MQRVEAGMYVTVKARRERPVVFVPERCQR